MSVFQRKGTAPGSLESMSRPTGALAPPMKRQKLNEAEEALWHAEIEEQKRQNVLNRARWPRKPCRTYSPDVDKVGTHLLRPLGSEMLHVGAPHGEQARAPN